jgi:integrase
MVRRHFLPALEGEDLHRIRFHDLRHTYASLLIDLGENLKYIQMQPGHRSPTVTLNVFAHFDEAHQSRGRLLVGKYRFWSTQSQNGHRN